MPFIGNPLLKLDPNSLEDDVQCKTVDFVDVEPMDATIVSFLPINRGSLLDLYICTEVDGG